jgi:subtilase family serine protease
MKKRIILILIIILLIICLPMTGYSLTSSGTFYQDMNSGVPGASYTVINGYVKYNYHPGAKLSRYYFVDSASRTYFAYPIRAPIGNYSGEVQGWGGYEISWASAMNGGSLTSVVPQCYGAVLAFRNTCNGPITGYGTITATYSTLFKAYAYILKNGYYGANDQGARFGLSSSEADQAAKYYATNMAMQRLSSQSLTNYDIGGYDTAGVTDLRVTNFAYYLENEARKILCSNINLFSDLQGSIGAPTRLNSSYVRVPITVSIPTNENPAFYSNYTNFHWADLSNMNCPNASSVSSALSNFSGGRTVTANLQIGSASIKGGERIAYYVQGKVATTEALGRIFITGGGNIQAYILCDPSSIGSTTITQNLNQVFVAGYLPKFDTISSTITVPASFNAGNTGTVSVTYKNNSRLPAVNVPVSLASSSSLGTPFTITNPNRTISELQAGASTTVNYTVKANTLSGNATATFTAKIGYNTDNSTRFNETNYTNNTLKKTTTVYSLPDLIVSALIPDKSSYEAGETVTITATIKNNGNTTSAACQASIAYNTDHLASMSMGNKVVPALAAGASTTVTFTGTAKALGSNTNTSVTVTVDTTNVVTESNENNNTRSTSFTINKALPDLIVSALVSDKSSYEANEPVTITATIKNTGYAPTDKTCLARISFNTDQLIPVDAEDKTISVLEANGTQTVTLTFLAKIPILDEENNVAVTVMADASNVISEISETNNSSTLTINAKAALPDFTVDFTTTPYNANRDVIITGTVKNIGLLSHPSVPVRLTVDGVVYNDVIPVPTAEENDVSGWNPAGANLAVFRVHIPDKARQSIIISMEVDPDNIIKEYNESNNVKTVTETINTLELPDFIDSYEPSIENNYISHGKQIPQLPALTSANSATWTEIRYTAPTTYTSVTFQAVLASDFSVAPANYCINPDKPGMIESGFGIEANTMAGIVTNYDHPEKLVGAQDVWLWWPETYYGTESPYLNYREAASSNNPGALTSTWALPVNPFSVKGYSVHYIPLWFPDGPYTVINAAQYAWSPAGAMYMFSNGTITVAGDMYDRIMVVAN